MTAGPTPPPGPARPSEPSPPHDPGYPAPDAGPAGLSGPGAGLPPRGAFGIRTEPPPPAHRWGIGAFVVVELIFLGVSALIGQLVPMRGVVGILLALSVPTLLAAGTALALTRWRGNGPKLDLGLRWCWEDVGAGILIGLLGLLLTVPAALIYASVVGPAGATSAVGDVFADVRTGWPMALLVMFVVVVVAPICEEIVYRGLLWGAVARYTPNRWLVYLITTLLFALAHFELTRTPLLFVVALPLGLARVLTGRLGASILAHQVNNFLPGLALALMLVGVLPSG